MKRITQYTRDADNFRALSLLYMKLKMGIRFRGYDKTTQRHTQRKMSNGLSEEGQCLSRHLGLVAEDVAAPAATRQNGQSQPRGVGVCARGTEARDEGLGARARHLYAGRARGKRVESATLLSTSPHLAPKGAQGAASSLLANLGQRQTVARIHDLLWRAGRAVAWAGCSHGAARAHPTRRIGRASRWGAP